jgi:hypothetical protein
MNINSVSTCGEVVADCDSCVGIVTNFTVVTSGVKLMLMTPYMINNKMAAPEYISLISVLAADPELFDLEPQILIQTLHFECALHFW